MKIINGFITADAMLEVRIEPGDALANSMNPGSWETKSPAAGGSGIEWSSSPNARLEIPLEYVGTVCRVHPVLVRPVTVNIEVEADISTDKGMTYQPYSGEMEIQFVEPGQFTQLALVPTAAVLGYKKVVTG
jgi:hypothetical protein